MNKRIGFCAGVFDGINGLHPGHLHLLKTAREVCDYLIVACNSDDYIRAKKNREPLTTQSKRIEALYNTGLVDECIPFESDPLPIILFLKPELIITGNDYKPKDVTGYKECLSWGGKIVTVDRINNISTTNIIKELNKK